MYIARCSARISGDTDFPDGWAMPPPLVTQFTPSTCAEHPPSAFEAVASAYAARRGDDEHSTHAESVAAARVQVAEAETEFWEFHDLPSAEDSPSFLFGVFVNDGEWVAEEYGANDGGQGVRNNPPRRRQSRQRGRT